MYQYDTHVLTDGRLMAEDIRLLSLPAPIPSWPPIGSPVKSLPM
ncbi:hypothetical protein SynBIOSE41_03853 [Synechococcus sp. BIOS-E4-1]|nr:hypothetical protein SynBIOSE41_03853 [Synechococcus sp. BIOS-E4-1]